MQPSDLPPELHEAVGRVLRFENALGELIGRRVDDSAVAELVAAVVILVRAVTPATIRE